MATNNSINAPIPFSVPNGGTGDSSITAHSVLLGNGTSSVNVSNVGSNGQVLIGSNGANPAFASITAGSGISLTPGANSLTIASTGGLTITGDSGGALSPTTGNWNILGQQAGSIPVMDTIGSVSTLSIENRAYSSKFVVDASTTNGLRGTYSTIQSAITAASSGDIVIIRPGVYTENITLKNGVNLTGLGFVGGSGVSTEIVGKLIDNGVTVGCTLSNLNLTTNSDFIFSLTAASTDVVVNGCNINCSNNTGISTSANATISFYVCTGTLGTTGITYSTGAGQVEWYGCVLHNSGGSSTPSSTSGGIVIRNTTFECPLSTSSVGTLNIDNSIINLSLENAVCVTTAGTGTSFVRNSTLFSGTASSISIGTGTTVLVTHCSLNSSNTNVLTGAGTLQYALISFTGSSSGHNVSSESPLATLI